MSCLSALFSENCIFVFVYLCICVFVFVYFDVRHLGTLFLRSSYHYLFKNIAHVMSIRNFDQCCICVFVYLCICVFVFVYLQVRRLATLFLSSLYHYLFKYIAHDRHNWNIDPSWICVFVYLCICVFTFVCLHFRHLGTLSLVICFQKICVLYGLIYHIVDKR